MSSDVIRSSQSTSSKVGLLDNVRLFVAPFPFKGQRQRVDVEVERLNLLRGRRRCRRR